MLEYGTAAEPGSGGGGWASVGTGTPALGSAGTLAGSTGAGVDGGAVVEGGVEIGLDGNRPSVDVSRVVGGTLFPETDAPFPDAVDVPFFELPLNPTATTATTTATRTAAATTISHSRELLPPLPGGGAAG